MVSDCNVRRISGLNSDEHVQDHARDKSACTQKEYAVPQFGCKSYACAIQVSWVVFSRRMVCTAMTLHATVP